jgi:dipeptidyl aminopeptidase/acylaminoacyl peptidase
MFHKLYRREFMALVSAALARGQDRITRPIVSEDACPLLAFSPVAKDGHRGRGFFRKPTGRGPFPAIVFLHGGNTELPSSDLQDIARAVTPSRFLAAGYALLVPTCRSRDVDPQSPASLADCLAAVEYTRRLPYIDPKSIVVYGCSGGGDLALQVAAATDICAIVPEEPASMMIAGIANIHSAKQGERFTPGDAIIIAENPEQYYTPEYQKILRSKIRTIRCPILIIQGDVERREAPINHFNARVLIPELENANKNVKVIIYPGEPHCFFLMGSGCTPGGACTPHPAAALKAFRDIDAFCRSHVLTNPKALDSSLVRQESI